jgi:hypothetical protein
LIDEAYAGPLRNGLGTFRAGTMLILDEAHHAAHASGQRNAIDSQITLGDPRAIPSVRTPIVSVRHAVQRPFKQLYCSP